MATNRKPRVVESGHYQTPLRVPGLMGESFKLSDQDYHLAVLTSAGTMELQTFIASGIASVPGDTPGEQIVEGAFASRDLSGVRGMLDRCTFEELPVNIEEQASPKQLEEVVNLIFQQAGLRWLTRMLANLTQRAMTTLEARMAPLVDHLVDQSLESSRSGTENQ